MNINTNTWNKIRYTFYTPGYDLVARYFKASRQKSIESLTLKPGDKILIVGAGTGLDLEFLPKNCDIIATDITPSMIARTKERGKFLNLGVQAIEMDGQDLAFEDDSFDAVILHLILAVIPDPIACIKEAERVVREGGEIIVFDKFIRPHQPISFLRKSMNVLTSFLMTDITRNFEAIKNATNLKVVSNIDADFNGNFRLIKMVKK